MSHPAECSTIARQVLSRKLIETVDMMLQVEWEVEPALQAYFAELRVVRAELRNHESQERAGNPDRIAKR